MHFSSLAALATLAGSIVLGGAAAPWQRPDFSGVYKLDPAASRGDAIGARPGAEGSVVLHIEHRDPSFVLRMIVGSETSADTETVALTTDGREVVKRRGENRESSAAVWSGDTLVITNRMTTADGQSTIVLLLIPLDGGRTLEMRLRPGNPGQSDGRVNVFRRIR